MIKPCVLQINFQNKTPLQKCIQSGSMMDTKCSGRRIFLRDRVEGKTEKDGNLTDSNPHVIR